MAAPTTPTQQYDFEDFSASNPTGQQPGDKLDEEFAHHRQKIAEIVNFVRTQIGDDGYLKGGLVDLDQIGSDVIALFNTDAVFKGTWTTSTVYAIGEVAQYDQNKASYVCTTAHTSGVFLTDRDTNNYWQLFAYPPEAIPTTLADRLSGDGTTGPFTLTEEISNDDEKFLFVFDHENKIMDPVTDYTVVGDQLTFTSNTTSGTNNYQVRALSYGLEALQVAVDAAKTAAELAETNAEASETAAATSASNAATSAAAAATTLDDFDDIFLGSKASDPTLDNDGDALTDGCLFWDTTLNVLKVYDLGGTTWKQTTPTTSQQTNIDAVAADATDIGTVAGISSDVTTVSGISSDVTTVSGISSNVTTVAGISSDVTTVVGMSSDVTTVSGISSDVTTVAGDATDIGTVAGISSNVTAVSGISSDVTTVSGISSDVTTVSGVSGNVTTVASNIAGVNSFAEKYRVEASDPASSLDQGDLVFNTGSSLLKYYNGSAWVAVSAPDVTLADATALAIALG